MYFLSYANIVFSVYYSSIMLLFGVSLNKHSRGLGTSSDAAYTRLGYASASTDAPIPWILTHFSPLPVQDVLMVHYGGQHARCHEGVGRVGGRVSIQRRRGVDVN